MVNPIAAGQQQEQGRAGQLAAQLAGRLVGLLAKEGLGLGEINMCHWESPREISVTVDTDILLDFPGQENYIPIRTKKETSNADGPSPFLLQG
jgi:hypothetical protein